MMNTWLTRHIIIPRTQKKVKATPAKTKAEPSKEKEEDSDDEPLVERLIQ